MLITIYTSGMGVLSPVRGHLNPVVVGRPSTIAAQNLHVLKYMQGE